MAIDPSIALGVRPAQIENPFDQYAKVAQFKQMQQQNRLADLMFAGKERETRENNALSDLYKSTVGADGKLDRSALMTKAAQGGLGRHIPVLQKTFADQDKATADLEKTRFDATTKKLEIAGQAFGYVRNNPTLEAATQVLDYLEKNGVYDAGTVAQYKQMVAGNPAAIKQLADQAFMAVLSAKEHLPSYQTRNTGGTTDTLETNPVTGAVKVVNSVKNTMTPDGIAADARGRDANRLKEREIGVTEQGIVGKKVQDVELKLQDDYRTESKGFAETSTAMKKILGAISTADKNPGSALAAGTAFMKLLDPNSVVRESELGMALNASGWFDRATNIANTLQSGKVMTATQQKNLKAAAENLFEEAKSAQREVDGAYEQRAKAYGADPSRVIVDRGQKAAAAPKPAANIPQGAIDMLKKNPALRAQFEAKYGQGSAASVLDK